MTYKQQFDKLTVAYINGEVDPFNCKACFCGNLLNNRGTWIDHSYRGEMRGITYRYFYKDREAEQCVRDESNGFYTIQEILYLEKIFLDTFRTSGGILTGNMELLKGLGRWTSAQEETQENALFKAFEVTLEALKQIHISKGEIIDDAPIFKKRKSKKYETEYSVI